MWNRLLLVLVLVLFSPIIEAKWLCEEAASIRSGEVITTCGIGESKKEDEARKLALKSAFKELDMVCSRSLDCRDFELVIEPLRNDCHKKGETYKCYRAINAEVTTQKKKVSEQNSKALKTDSKQAQTETLKRIDQLIGIFSNKEKQEIKRIGPRYCDYKTDEKFSLFSDLTRQKNIRAGALEAKKVPFREGCLKFHVRLMNHLSRHNKRSPIYEKYLISQIPGITALSNDNRFELIIDFFHHYGEFSDSQFDLFFESFKRSYGRNHYRTSGSLFHKATTQESKKKQKSRIKRYIVAAKAKQLGRPVFLDTDQSFIYLARGLNQSHFEGDSSAYRYMMNQIFKSHNFVKTRQWTTILKRFFFSQKSMDVQSDTLSWLKKVIDDSESNESLSRFFLDFVREFSRKISKLDDEEDEEINEIKLWENLKAKFLSMNSDKIDKTFASIDKKHLKKNFYDFCLVNKLECKKTLPSLSKIKKMLKSKKYQKRLLALNILTKKPESAKVLVPEVYAGLKEARKNRRPFYRIIKPSVEVLLVAETQREEILAEMLDVSWDKGFNYEELADRLGKKLVPELLKHIDKSRNQLVAIRMLGQIGAEAKEALPHLKKLTDKKNHYSVRDAAEKSIEQISKP